jgi:pimeloyl-ACP methyl ester carboxylesterase
MPNPTIVLVHGAFGDASSWRPVYDRLVGDGHTVLAPPNPLRGIPTTLRSSPRSSTNSRDPWSLSAIPMAAL